MGSRAHAITKLIRPSGSGSDEYIVIVCERNDVFASASAVARAFPLYSRKTNQANAANADNHEVDKKSMPYTVTVEFILVGDVTTPLSPKECKLLEQAAESIRTAARIVDTPCSTHCRIRNFGRKLWWLLENLRVTWLFQFHSVRNFTF